MTMITNRASLPGIRESDARGIESLESGLNSGVIGPQRRLGVIAYIPPSEIGFPDVFVRNLQENKTANRLILLSDNQREGTLPLPCPDLLVGAHGRLATINLIFLLCFAVAVRENLTHFIYVESDCRVLGNHWDRRLFEELFRVRGIAGGHLAAIFRRREGSGWDRFQKIACEFNGRDYSGALLNRPVILHLRSHPSAPFIFLNGAFTVLDVEAFRQLLCPLNLVQAASSWGPWDAELGIRVCHRFGIDTAFELLRHIPFISSTSGDAHYSYGERIAMLDGNRIVGVHQIKTPWVPAVQPRTTVG